jgi:hypothetical protein
MERSQDTIMSEEFASREELNAIGAKVASLSESCIACRTALTSDVRHLNEELKETKRDVYEIKGMVQKISDQVGQLTIKVSIVVAIIVAVINFLAPIIINLPGMGKN